MDMNEDKSFIKEIAPGLYEINNGNITIQTGEKGKKMLNEALEEEARRLGIEYTIPKKDKIKIPNIPPITKEELREKFKKIFEEKYFKD
jgi:hypothetical protein